MPGAAAWSLQRLNDDVAQHVISYASLDGCQALSLTCRRFCNLVRRTCTHHLELGVLDDTPQRLARMPADRVYQRVNHLSLSDADWVNGHAGNPSSWVRLCQMMGIAMRRWPGVERVTLTAGWGYGYLMGAVAPLCHATGLRSLTINRLADSYSLLHLRLLTQLTELCLTPSNTEDVCLALTLNNPHKAALADMTHLRALSLSTDARFRLCGYVIVDQASVPLVLPPHLTRLEALVPHCHPGMFWRHMAACSRLVRLTVHVNDVAAAEGHPSWMLHHLARSLSCLEHLCLGDRGTSSTSIDTHLPAVLTLLAGTEAGQQQQEEHGWDWRDLPAVGQYAWGAVVPPPNMCGMSALRTLEVNGCWSMHLWCPHHWHALAGCTGLQQLHMLQAWQPPPPGVKFPCVADLKVSSCMPLDALPAMLGAFPALQQLRLDLNPQSLGETCCDAHAGVGVHSAACRTGRSWGGGAPPTAAAAAAAAASTGAGDRAGTAADTARACGLGSLASAHIYLCKSAPALTPFYSTLWRAMPALRRLNLGWPLDVDLLQQLPPVSTLQGLQALNLFCVHTDGPLGWQYVGLQGLLKVLQGATQLEKLELQVVVSHVEGIGPIRADDHSHGSDSSRDTGRSSSTDGACGGGIGSGHHSSSSSSSSSSQLVSKDQLVLHLQEALPSLRKLLLSVEGPEQPLAADTRAAVHPALQVVAAGPNELLIDPGSEVSEEATSDEQ